ncbi:MAG: hypothetical protein IK066_07525 [Kiritimatiellae bacterium]|nr:hypothetical protein [Kiritimatiellia bacterium]
MNAEKITKTIKIFGGCKEKIDTALMNGSTGKALCRRGALAVLLVLATGCSGGNAKNIGESSVDSREVGTADERIEVGGSNELNDGSVGAVHIAENDTEEPNDDAQDDIQTRLDGQAGREYVDARGWKYTGEDFKNAFFRPRDDDEYNGVIYRHFANANDSIEVLHAFHNGYLVEKEYHPIWVETQKHYENGEPFGRGFYVRLGQIEVEINRGYKEKDTVLRYLEVTDTDVLEKIRAQIEEEEGKPVDVDVPVKSLCGFSIGTTPSGIGELCKSLRNHSAGDNMGLWGELVTPFRYCDEVLLEFSTKPPLGGRHLCYVELYGKVPQDRGSMMEQYEEVKTIVAMMEKKFGIKFQEIDTGTHGSFCYGWETENGEDSIPQSITVGIFLREVKVVFKSDLMSPREWYDWWESQRSPKLSADAGSDQL